MNKPIAYFSLDVETLGTVGGLHPLLSIGAAVFDYSERLRGDYEVNLLKPPDLVCDLETVAWWQEPARSEAFFYSTQEPVPAECGIKQFLAWHDSIAEQYDLQYLGKPTVFDYSFIQYYCLRFGGRPLLQRARAIDIHSLMAALTGCPINELHTSCLPAGLLDGLDCFMGVKHTALDDAIYQGLVGLRCLKLFARIRDTVNIQNLVKYDGPSIDLSLRSRRFQR